MGIDAETFVRIHRAVAEREVSQARNRERIPAMKTDKGIVDLSAVKPGQIVAAGNKIYGRCRDCRELVRVDKWLLGSLHFCVPTKELR